MDEPIWIFIGVVSAIIGLGIVAQTILRGNESGMEDQAKSAVALLAAQCEQVCKLPENTAIDVKIDVPKGMKLEVREGSICAIIKERNFCERCGCDHLQEPIVLDTTSASAFFSAHMYSCRYDRLDTGMSEKLVKVTCTG